MSVFNYNYYKNLKRPITYIGTPRKHIIGTIKSYELQTDLYANAINSGSFKVYRYENEQEIIIGLKLVCMYSCMESIGL